LGGENSKYLKDGINTDVGRVIPSITHLPPAEREVYRNWTAERINVLKKNNNPQHTHSTHSETKTIKSIKTKLRDNEAIIT
jgi:hypothetical protein